MNPKISEKTITKNFRGNPSLMRSFPEMQIKNFVITLLVFEEKQIPEFLKLSFSVALCRTKKCIVRTFAERKLAIRFSWKSDIFPPKPKVTLQIS